MKTRGSLHLEIRIGRCFVHNVWLGVVGTMISWPLGIITLRDFIATKYRAKCQNDFIKLIMISCG